METNKDHTEKVATCINIPEFIDLQSYGLLYDREGTVDELVDTYRNVIQNVINHHALSCWKIITIKLPSL